jgi:hypothetical protein
VIDHRTVILDNEAVQALIDLKSRKHRLVLSAVELAVRRNKRRTGEVSLVVPTTVRVESGWDRSAATAAAVNRLQFEDAELTTSAADRAAAVRSALDLSVADAHLAVVLSDTRGPHAVVTSDRKDLGRIAAHLGMRVNIVPV